MKITLTSLIFHQFVLYIINADFDHECHIVHQSHFTFINIVLTITNVVFQKQNMHFTFQFR